MDQANIKASLWNVLFILVVVITFIPLVKIATNKWLMRVPGLPVMVNSI